MMNIDNKIVALYVRVSTGYQVDKDSLPFQKKELAAYCEHVLHIDKENIRIYEDAGKSGKNTKRPAFERMMKEVRRDNVSHVLVYKLDRISRNLVDFSIMYDEFKDHGTTFISLNEQFDTSSAMGETMLKLVLVFAELERKMTSERVTDIMLSRAKSGKWNGARMPYGWAWNSEKEMPEHDPVESLVVKDMYTMYLDVKSTDKIRNYLNQNNIYTKRGGEWTNKTVADIIRNPMNKGDYRYNYRNSARGKKKPDDEVIYVKNVFSPIVDVATWEKATKIMDKNAEFIRLGHKRSLQSVYCNIFAGLLTCYDCNANMHTVSKDKPRANGFRPTSYRCGNRLRKRTCYAKGTSDVKVGPVVINFIANMVKASNSEVSTKDELEALLLSGDAFSTINIKGLESTALDETFGMVTGTDNFSNLLSEKKPVIDTGKIDALKANLEKAERAIERLKKAYYFADDAMTEKEFLETKQSFEKQRIDIQNELDDLVDVGLSNTLSNEDFIKSASNFFLLHELSNKDQIIYSDLAASIDDKTLKEFVTLIISEVVIKDSLVYSITFKSGLKHTFLYQKD
ncbi:recombinase family protein [Lachnospiraceae bacterium OttesenSCG-928-J05]|nr:recombinase family protein [Lachnospiraceae bacterium OttesenSCG-928-J05]